MSKVILSVDWDYDLIDAIDTSKLGKTEIQGRLSPLFEGFGLTNTFPLILTVEVRDPSTPCIEEIYPSGEGATLVFWDDFDNSSGNNKIWRSDDGGNNWVDFTNSPDLEWDEWSNDRVFFWYKQLTSPVMFFIEVDGKESNVATIYEKDGQTYGGIGGDRTGSDRPGGGKPDVGDKPGDAGNPDVVNPVSNNPIGGNPVSNNPISGNPVSNNPSGGNPVSNNPIGGNPVSNNPSGSNPDGGSPSGGNTRSNTHNGAISSDDNDSNLSIQNEQQYLPDVPSAGNETIEKATGDIADGTPNRTIPVMDQDAPLAGNTPPATVPVLALILTGSASLAGIVTLTWMKIRKVVR